MIEINISELRDDVEDRLDNEVIIQRMPESLRQKLTSKKRVTRAMNQAVSLFLSDADPATISNFVDSVDLSKDEEVGDAGIEGNVATYLWPETAFTAREDAGLLKVILDGEERNYDMLSNTSLDSVRYQANSTLYGDSYKICHVDVVGKRIYAPKSISMGARIVSQPEKINDDDTYSSGVDAADTLPISIVFMQTLANLTIGVIKEMGQIQGPPVEESRNPEPENVDE